MASEHVIKYDPSSRHARGKACLNCRRRKIKCDGERPMCGQCVGARGTFDDCEYSDGQPSQAQLLEEKISEVRTRIDKLEKGAQPSPEPPSFESIYPYSFDASSHAGIEPVDLLGIGSSTSLLETRLSLHPFQEPYTEHRSLMLDAFYSQCHHFGLFLTPNRLYRSFLLPLPLGHFSRPTAALLNVVYLWGVHLSPSSPGIYDESGFLRSTLHHLTKDLAGSHPYKVIHTIQAEVLLSYYYLTNGRLLEGSYHANAALSLSISAGLNRLPTLQASQLVFGEGSSVNHHAASGSWGPDSTITNLPPPIDIIEENERIDAFWAALILNNYWVAIQESHSMLFDPLDARIDTPWPTDSPYHVVHCENGNTLQQFLECTSVEGISAKALHAKATILLDQATTIHSGEFETDALRSEALTRLDSLIEQFKTILPLDGSLSPLPLEGEVVALSRMIAQAATIRLHLPSSANKGEIRDRCISSAKCIALITENMIPANSGHMQLDPIMGIRKSRTK